MANLLDANASSDFQSAADANMVAFWAPYGRATVGEMDADTGSAWFCTGIGHPLFNGVIRADLREAEVQPFVDRLAEELGRARTSGLWWLGPRARPMDLDSRLEALGLSSAGEVPGMVVELVSLQDEAGVDGLTIRRVDDATGRDHWARTACAGNEFTAEVTDGMAAIETRINDPEYSRQIRYIGYLDGKPVATSCLVLHAGLAGIYAVATLPDARGRGIGRQMTLDPLLEARRLGYSVGVLQASSMGRPVYEWLGFREFCTYRIRHQS